MNVYQRTFHGRPDQVRQVRQDLTRHLAGSPVTADAILISSELATNAIALSQQRRVLHHPL
jgi:hypothetical protein